MRHVIIGGCGFTGRHLRSRLLDRGERVLVVDLPTALADAGLPSSHALAVDIQDPASVANIPLGPDDVVHHLAARQFHGAVPRRGRGDWFAAVNVVGTRHLLERMMQTGCRRLIYFSSDMVYGVPDRVPVPTRPSAPPLGTLWGEQAGCRGPLCRLSAARCLGHDIQAASDRRPRPAGRAGQTVRTCSAWLAGAVDRKWPEQLPDDLGVRLHHRDRGGTGPWCPRQGLQPGFACPPDRARAPGADDRVGRIAIKAPSRARPPPKATLAALDTVGLTLLYPEQFLIADMNYLVDIGSTVTELGWQPIHGDAEMMAAAYEEFCASIT